MTSCTGVSNKVVGECILLYCFAIFLVSTAQGLRKCVSVCVVMGMMGFEQALVTFHLQEGRAGSERPTTWRLDQLCHLQTNRRLD